MTLKTLAFIFAAATVVSAAALPAQAAPSFGGGLAQGAADNPLLQDVQHRTFVYRGRPYCFYFDGWHGAGWYRCGWNWRRGFGWGGVYGWNSWEYGPAIRRFGYRHHHRGGHWAGRNSPGGPSIGGARVSPNGTVRGTTGFSRSAPVGGRTMTAPAPSGGPSVGGGGGGGGAGGGGGGGSGGHGGGGSILGR